MRNEFQLWRLIKTTADGKSLHVDGCSMIDLTVKDEIKYKESARYNKKT